MMGIKALEDSKELRAQGKRLGRKGLAERVLHLLNEYKDPSYKEAMELAGRLHALSLASRFDQYWEEQTLRGFQRELNALPQFVIYRAGWYQVKHLKDDMWTTIWIFEDGRTWAHAPHEEPRNLDLDCYELRPL